MQFRNALLGGVLASSASAIDIRFHNGGSCAGAAQNYANVNPNICCLGDSASVAIAAIPTNWAINVQGYSGGGCGSPKWSGEARNTNFYCMSANSRPNYSGAFYYFPGRKRGDEVADSQCKGQLGKPDGILLADGVTEYNVTSLPEAEVESLWALASSGVGPEGMPAYLEAHRRK
ncbi:hypothetical protein GGTG_12516 [Gaeumannomyces tritici R3-111a-1]|uniref:Uncharacterized protein n=1 Tax=Gaeumannomyces tritici (strain R3-111a-1) TaxID=644352 RepID=J3PG92_GAET3|nr:hypothetical protein GGTG_12516 [Gaeumannomyces tritici R3-111a-1]EJT69632.1 hypothetical protein GGTG_12516 [Gaeumannomyces tritici R3-111a-1]